MKNAEQTLAQYSHSFRITDSPHPERTLLTAEDALAAMKAYALEMSRTAWEMGAAHGDIEQPDAKKAQDHFIKTFLL